MLPATTPKVTRKFSPQVPRFPGICAFAKANDVDRVHAYRVLIGKRQSGKLRAAWQKFQKQEAGR